MENDNMSRFTPWENLSNVMKVSHYKGCNGRSDVI